MHLFQTDLSIILKCKVHAKERNMEKQKKEKKKEEEEERNVLFQVATL